MNAAKYLKFAVLGRKVSLSSSTAFALLLEVKAQLGATFHLESLLNID